MCKSSELNKKELEVLWILNDFIKRKGFPPTLREIVNNSSIKSTSTVKIHLDRLERMEFIERIRGCSRAITILKK